MIHPDTHFTRLTDPKRSKVPCATDAIAQSLDLSVVKHSSANPKFPPHLICSLSSTPQNWLVLHLVLLPLETLESYTQGLHSNGASENQEMSGNLFGTAVPTRYPSILILPFLFGDML